MSASALLQNPQVQKELEIVADQKTALKKIADDESAARREAMTGMQGLSREEMQAKMAELRTKSEARAKETQKKIDEVLLPPQAKRLKEILVQIRGNGALLDKEVQATLKISDEQAKKLTAIQDDAGAKRRELFQGGGAGGDRAAMQEKMAQLQKEVGEQMLGVLNADQKEAFAKMKGKEFKLDMSAMRRGGPGGAGGRGGRGGAQPSGN
ncbi:MAG: hypothetical protein ACYC35_08675 [Pirellulales bacterium]